jgi:hypothetical protein
MEAEDPSNHQARRFAIWLPRLAEPIDVAAASNALWSIALDTARHSKQEVERSASREQEDEQGLIGYKRALDLITNELDELIPAWIARLLEQLQSGHDGQQRREAAIKSRGEMPSIDIANIFAVDQLVKVLQATGDRIDPYLNPIIQALNLWDRDRDEHLCSVLEYAGQGIMRAISKLLEMFRLRGVWCWPSHLSRALANASRFDRSVVGHLQEMLRSDHSPVREAAISVLGAIGPAARDSSDQLLTFHQGSEAERCGMIDALAQQGSPTAKILDLFAEAMGDDNGYVRRAAIYALGKLTPDAERFVPLLIEACDYPHYLHDTSLPAAAVKALAQYGPRAQMALARLELFVQGPVIGRTVPAKDVLRAIGQIAPHVALRPAAGPSVRTIESVGEDEPLFAVTYEGHQCYIDRLGHVVIQTQFSHGGAFSDKRAIVRDATRTAVIDRLGQVVFESDWNDIKPFSEGLAAVRKGRKWGFVDLDGKLVVEPQYDSVTSFSEGLAGFEVGRTEDTIGSLITLDRPGLRGFIDRTGRVAIPAVWTDAQPFKEGRSLVCTGGTRKPNPLVDGRDMLTDRKFGFIDRAGRLVVPGHYDLFSGSFSEGLAVVQIGDGMLHCRYGYVDLNGRQVIAPTLKSATSFKDGVALVKKRGRRHRPLHFVIDPRGQVVAELTHPAIEAFSEGLAAASSGDIYGFVDIRGQWAIEPQFDQCEPFSHGVAEVQRGDWYGLIDTSGKFIWGPTTEGMVSRVIESEWVS